MSVAAKIMTGVHHLTLFKGVGNVMNFRSLANKPKGEEPITFDLRKPPVSVACRGGTSDGEVLWDVFARGYHKEPKALPDNAVILDLGANIGLCSLDYGLRYPQAKIIAVELDAGNAELAAQNTQILGDRCQVVQGAIWSEDGEIGYGGDEGEWGFRVTDYDGAVRDASQTAPAMRIETLLDQHGIEWVDFMKMDIEGAEADVLLPGSEWLDKVGSINLEIHLPATYESCAKILTDAGFTCSRAELEHSLLAVR